MTRPSPAPARTALTWGLAVLTAACSGGSGTRLQPHDLAYPQSSLDLRVGQPAPPLTATWGGERTDAAFTASPGLPDGLVLDPETGSLSGTPAIEHANTSHVITVTNAHGEASATLQVDVGPTLPPALSSLWPGFRAETVVDGARFPARLAAAPDGRVFYSELQTGEIRVIDAQGQLLPAPFATLPVLGGGHLGLLGLAISPDRAAAPELFVMVCTPAGGGHVDRSRILRFGAAGDIGAGMTVVLDDLPLGAINNGGALAFDQTGHLLVSIGDTLDPALAQDDAALAGKILRVRADGGIPADNPDPGSYVFCKGLRNTFALTVHPRTGGIFGGDNGPNSDDELNFLQAGKNFEWGSDGSGFGAATGFRMHHWADVVVPTGLAFHDGGGSVGTEWTDVLFTTLYDPEQIVCFRLSGNELTDVDELLVFAQFAPQANDRKPLDIALGPDGSLWVATFTGIHRMWR